MKARSLYALPALIVLAACSTTSQPADRILESAVNPAAAYCESQGGVYTIVRADGSSTCTLPSGDTVDAWEYYRQHSGT